MEEGCTFSGVVGLGRSSGSEERLLINLLTYLLI